VLTCWGSYFTPYFLPGAGTFQDGGLTYNNPASIAIRETAALFPAAPEPSLVLSLGTGSTQPETDAGSEPTTTSEPAPVWSTMWATAWGKSFPSRLFRAFWKQGDADAAWKHLLRQPPTRERGGYFRFDLRFGSASPALDDVRSMAEVAERARETAIQSPDLPRLAGQLRAELFVFELDSLPHRLRNGAYQCSGHLVCRLPPGTAAYETFMNQLAQCSASFQCQERILPGRFPAPGAMIGEGRFHQPITIQVPTRQDEFHITLHEGPSACGISGSPFTLARLVRQQNLDAAFGRADHQ
jgi:hypothetical protein